MASDGLRQRAAAELAHESFLADTPDHEDHTFNGIMFDVSCCDTLPMDYVVIESIWVRGQLGPMRVFYTPDSFQRKHEKSELWTKVYENFHNPSPTILQELRLDSPIVLRPGKGCGLYVHSAIPGDEGLVYDNQRRSVTHKDDRLIVHPGLAHLNSEPFDSESPWGGMWGHGWRLRREFVGRISYSVRWLLWNPDVHTLFPVEFQQVAKTMLLGRRKAESILSQLPVEIVWLILNKCWWDWFGTTMPPKQKQTPLQEQPPPQAQGDTGSASSSRNSQQQRTHPTNPFGDDDDEPNNNGTTTTTNNSDEQIAFHEYRARLVRRLQGYPVDVVLRFFGGDIGEHELIQMLQVNNNDNDNDDNDNDAYDDDDDDYEYTNDKDDDDDDDDDNDDGDDDCNKKTKSKRDNDTGSSSGDVAGDEPQQINVVFDESDNDDSKDDNNKGSNNSNNSNNNNNNRDNDNDCCNHKEAKRPKTRE